MKSLVVGKDDTSPLIESTETAQTSKRSIGWFEAFRQIVPIYLVSHVVFLILTYVAFLFLIPTFAYETIHPTIHSLILSWYRWDSVHFRAITLSSYQQLPDAAFFPLYPLLTRTLMLAMGHAFLSALIISNLATLGLFMVFYRLVAEDFSPKLAWRCVLYFAIFPTAFFFAAAYNESLALFFALLSFYYMRRGRWWLAGFAAVFAGLTRSSAIGLLIPFCYEYLRQHDFQIKKIRFDILSCAGIAGGIVIFSIYCYWRFHDFLAFSHAQATWDWTRFLSAPWEGALHSLHVIYMYRFLNFYSMHNVIDLSIGFCFLLLLILSFWGPWRFARKDWAYPLYGVALYLFFILVPQHNLLPLASFSRFMLEIPAGFIVLAIMGKKRNFNMAYLIIALPLLTFFLLQFLTGGWSV